MIGPQDIENFDYVFPDLLLTGRTPEGFKELLVSEVRFQSNRTRIIGLS